MWTARVHRGSFPQGEVAMSIDFYESQWRGDIDNLCKQVLDAVVKAGVVGDDRQVTALHLRRMRVRTTQHEKTYVRMEPA
jgi:Holliday junction resolvase RusA-like endonuclease